MRWVPFGKILKNDAYVNIIHSVGETYGKRPSDLIGITDDAIALDFDAAVLVRARNLQEVEKEKEEKINKQTNGKYKTGIEGIHAMQGKN